MFEDKSHKSAKIRKSPSAPAVWLMANEKVRRGPFTLDYGCGHGTDADVYNWDRYDPTWFPNKITKTYPFIVCIYVLNVVREEVASVIVKRVKRLLMPNGVAYFAVRTDAGMKEGYGPYGHLQRRVVLDLPIVRKNCQFCIYEMKKGD